MLQAVRRQLTELARISDDRAREDASTSDTHGSPSTNNDGEYIYLSFFFQLFCTFRNIKFLTDLRRDISRDPQKWLASTDDRSRFLFPVLGSFLRPRRFGSTTGGFSRPKTGHQSQSRLVATLAKRCVHIANVVRDQQK